MEDMQPFLPDPLDAYDPEKCLKPSEVAQVLGHIVSAKTITRWADDGQITPMVTTLGGHKRFPIATVRALRDRLLAPAEPDI